MRKKDVYPPKKFLELYREFEENERGILEIKAGEYSSDEDRLQNFREIANFIGDQPATIDYTMVAFILLMKHIQSIKNAIVNKRFDWAWGTGNKEGLKQRFADARNYLLLLGACIDNDSNSIKNSREKIAKDFEKWGFKKMPMAHVDDLIDEKDGVKK